MNVNVNLELFQEKLNSMINDINSLIDTYDLLKKDYDKIVSAKMSGSIYEQIVINHVNLLQKYGNNINSLKSQCDTLISIFNKYVEEYQNGI